MALQNQPVYACLTAPMLTGLQSAAKQRSVTSEREVVCPCPFLAHRAKAMAREGLAQVGKVNLIILVLNRQTSLLIKRHSVLRCRKNTT
jgi:hypothetical protein